jgi:hypothetical protein
MRSPKKPRVSIPRQISKPRRLLKNQKSKSVQDRKILVTEYLIGQLYLCADMCLDRNYVAIGYLEEAFRADTLLSLLQAPHLPNKVKAPVCKLIRTLYVDREPQVHCDEHNLVYNHHDYDLRFLQLSLAL